MKHIDVRYHFIRDQVTKGDINIQYINSKKLLAGIFINALSYNRFGLLRSKLGVVFLSNYYLLTFVLSSKDNYKIWENIKNKIYPI